MNHQQIAVAMARILPRMPHNPFSVVDVAPESYAELCASTTRTMPILAGYSDKTIFGAPEFNWLQRAIHDTIHLQLFADTTAFGEERVAIEQCRLVGQYSSFLADLTYADLHGQTAYFGRHGEFPTDQIGFTYYWLKTQDIERKW